MPSFPDSVAVANLFTAKLGLTPENPNPSAASSERIAHRAGSLVAITSRLTFLPIGASHCYPAIHRIQENSLGQHGPSSPALGWVVCCCATGRRKAPHGTQGAL